MTPSSPMRPRKLMIDNAARFQDLKWVERHVTGVRRLAGFRTASRGPVVHKVNHGVAF